MSGIAHAQPAPDDSTLEVSGVYVAGEWRRPGATLEDRNPAKPNELVATVRCGGAADVDDACRAARQAAGAWRRTSAFERAGVLWRTADILERRAEQIARELSREEGKTLAEARVEVSRAVATFRYYAGEAAQPIGEVFASSAADRFLYAIREPVGVVAIITPWNFPIAIPAWKTAPALAYGNAVVLKPSEESPLCAVRLVEALEEAGAPAGVVNLVCGEPAEVGPALTANPEVDAITFTGSPAVGRAVRIAAAERNVKVQLELGGKNAVIVLDDADLDLATDRTLFGAMWSAGQKCTATSRVLVTPRVADEFTERLAKAVGGLRVGDPLDESTDIGPVVSRSQWARVGGYLGVAREEGRHAVAGGAPIGGPDEGWYVQPTVYTDVPASSRIAREEIFGPVVAVMQAGGLDEAVALANDSDYGLSASIFTNDLSRAFRFLREIEAGVIHVNSESTGAEPHVPFGGMKGSSSHSREQGKAAMNFFTETKTAYVDPAC